MKKFPDFSFEIPLWKKGFDIIGIDEVGRGAFAGPVGVGGVVIDRKISVKEKSKILSYGINDSKKLSKKRREELDVIIRQTALLYCIVFVEAQVVNEIGVGKATQIGMLEVAKKLSEEVDNPYVLSDAFKIPVKLPQSNIIHGDSLSVSIAAASIIAKVARDSFMEDLSKKYPLYGFEKNKGYGTAFHRENIGIFGLSDQHRVDFCQKSALI